MDNESLYEDVCNEEDARLKRAERTKRGKDVTVFEQVHGRPDVASDYLDGCGHGRDSDGGL